jgi:hypothetical protein
MATVNGILADSSAYYVKLHTTENPNGVIRGQLEREEMVVLAGLMSPANEDPPIPDLKASMRRPTELWSPWPRVVERRS